MGSGTNLVTTVIGFGMSATFIVFMCTRINCGRIRESVESRVMYEIESRIDIEKPKHHANDLESKPVMLDAIPILKFNQETFSAIEDTQCVICLADYKEREMLRIMPKCDHTFHLSCIDIWLRKQSTCLVCRLPLKNSSEAKHVRTVAFTMSQPLDESHKNRPLSIVQSSNPYTAPCEVWVTQHDMNLGSISGSTIHEPRAK
ncbi:putative RING-H2 finger protein ATL61 [Arachis hypogaea]|uniref:putative RING-H2 finger protein ATL61 n=1 Tax=Arachis hypogaea TaxID=3818 RepID=UPI003B2235F6